MAESKEQQKDLQSGKKENLAGTPRIGGVIAKVVSYLKPKNKPRFIFKVPLGKPIGKVYYSVQSSFDPVTFTKKKDAVAFSKLLLISAAEVKSDIVRREITDTGYEVTYGERK